MKVWGERGRHQWQYIIARDVCSGGVSLSPCESSPPFCFVPKATSSTYFASVMMPRYPQHRDSVEGRLRYAHAHR